jgi:hypothetical protein
MRNTTLAIAGIAACTMGVLGGMAAHPTLKGPALPDWRERYRAFATAAPGLDYPVYQVAEAGYRYDLAAAGAAPAWREADYPAVEAEPAAAPLERSDWVVPAEEPVAEPDPDSGAAVVHVSLAQTAGIGPAPVIAAPSADLPQNGVGNPGVGD